MFFLVFILGLCVGSFLNVVICRLPKEEKISGRSRCPHCKKILAWYDLIPVFSFIKLRGKCRYCHQKISFQYPIVEISTALIFLAISNSQFLISNEFQIPNFQILNVLYWFIISSFLIAIFAIDLKHYIIPDIIVFPAIGIAFLYRLFEIWNFGHWDLFKIGHTTPFALGKSLADLGFGILPSVFFLGIILFSKGKLMGFGDFKLAILMGLFLGWPNILVALFLAFGLGAIIGIGLIRFAKLNLKSEIPLGPFLVTGTFAAMFWGQNIIDWYLNLLL